MKTHTLEKFIQRRGSIREQSKLLRRARRLYIALCTDSILADKTNATINLVAQRCLDSGLYCGPDIRSVRHGILGHMMRHEIKRGTFTPKRNGWKWHEWLPLRGWYSYTGERTADLKAVA